MYISIFFSMYSIKFTRLALAQKKAGKGKYHGGLNPQNEEIFSSAMPHSCLLSPQFHDFLVMSANCSVDDQYYYAMLSTMCVLSRLRFLCSYPTVKLPSLIE